MSAVIQNEYTGNGSTTTYSFTFPYLKTSDIKASLDGVDTTAFTLPNATTLQFNTAPGSGVKIKIFRDTGVDDLTATFYAGSAIKSEDLNDNFTQNLYKTQEVGGRFISNLGGTMTGDLNMGEDTVIKFEGATDDAHETTITVADPTADRTITFPNVTGTVVTTGDTGTVATGMIAGDAVNGDKIADNAINSEHYTDGSIDRVHLAADIVDGTKIADDSINSEHYVDGSIDTQHIANGQITSAKMAFETIETDDISADAITNAKIADNSIDSEHYVDGSIDNAHLASNSVTQVKMADDSVGTAELVDSSVVTATLADNAVTLAKMADNSVGTSELVNNAVTTVKIADDAITNAKIANGAINNDQIQMGTIITSRIADDNITTGKLADSAVTTVKIASSAVTTAKIANNAVTTAKIASNAVTSAEIADDAVGSSELGDGVIDTVHVGASQITDAKLASNAVTTAKITDANVTTAKIANDAITIGKIGCEQTTLSDSDSHIPTSGAVVDYVAAQIAPLGGLEVIATEVAFPNTQPASGVVISISDAGGVVVNGSGVSTTGRTVGGSTVTINGFPASLQSKTMAAGLGLMVSSTGSSQTYTYHKLLAKEADVEQLSNDINDFAARYRVGSSNPTSALDSGDLFFNTGTGKLLVYNGTNSAWEEAQSIGNFFISTFSESFDGSRTQFTLSNAPTNAQQIILSLNGVVQKPGTAFTLSGSTVTLASAPASGTDYFAVVMGSTVNIGTPSNNTVATAVLQDDAVTTAKIAAGAVGSTELGANAVITSKIADESITLAKLAHGTSSNNGKFLRANNGSDPTFESVITDLVNDTSPQLGGDLQSNGNDIDFADGDKAIFGTHGDMQIFHDSNNSRITNTGTGAIIIKNEVQDGDVLIQANDGGTNQNILNFDVSESALASFHGEINMRGTNRIRFYHNTGNGTFQSFIGQQFINNNFNMVIDNQQNSLFVQSDRITLRDKTGEGGEVFANFIKDGAVELYYNGNKKFETTSYGNLSTGQVRVSASNASTVAFSVGDQSTGFYNTGAHNIGLATQGTQKWNIDSSGNLRLNDNVAAKFGTGNDLQIYHDGNNKIESTSGNFQIGCTNNESIYIKTNNTNRWRFWYDGNFRPTADNTYDIGSSSARVRNIYTGDLHLSNRDSSNDVDGSWGDWTIQEGESDLFLKNNRSGKKYKFNLTEVV